MSTLSPLPRALKAYVLFMLGLVIFIMGAFVFSEAQRSQKSPGLETRATLSGLSINNLHKFEKAADSKRAVATLFSLSSNIRVMDESQKTSMLLESESKALLQMKVLLAKKLLPLPGNNCTDAVSCWLGSDKELPPETVAEILDEVKASDITSLLISAHNAQVSEMAMAPATFGSEFARAAYFVYVGFLVIGAAFAAGVYSRSRKED